MNDLAEVQIFPKGMNFITKDQCICQSGHSSLDQFLRIFIKIHKEMIK